jgi:hypothetical protein
VRELCPEQTSRILDGALRDPQAFPAIRFSEAVRAGAKLSQSDVAALSPPERQLLCAQPSNEPCQLTFHLGSQQVRCDIPSDYCSTTQLVIRPEHCWARNLCSDMICL